MTPYEAVKSAALVAIVGIVGLIGIHVAAAIDQVDAAAGNIERHAKDSLDRGDRDVNRAIDLVDGKANRALDEVHLALQVLDRTRKNADDRSSQALAIAQALPATVDRRLGLVQDEISSQLGTANHTLALAADQLVGPRGSVTLAMNRYTILPDQLAASPAWLSFEPEITCRHSDGTGYGGCMRSRVNGLLGEAERTGAEITKDSPLFLKNLTGITEDVHTFTSKAVAPRGVGGTIKDILTTGSGVVRAAGAAGVF
ncbi:MAG TPA: hypothetical protein VHZ74_10695 [Bryobacteraceae bacterium]|jgi:hypothetical protein|nr:hypothetical protein [Bryobacteraceae bacterium]